MVLLKNADDQAGSITVLEIAFQIAPIGENNHGCPDEVVPIDALGKAARNRAILSRMKAFLPPRAGALITLVSADTNCPRRFNVNAVG